MSSAFRRICVSLTLLTASATSLTAQNTALSAPLELTHGKPFVMVMVNGKGPFRFVVDTGTSAEAFVTAELADQLNLPVTGQVHLSDPSKQGGQRVPRVQIQSLEVAGVVFTDVKAARHNLSSADGNCDGLLGFELFRDYLLTLDYPNRRMTLTSGSLAPDGERSVLPFRTPYGIPIIPLHIGDLQIDAQIDSGGTGLSLPDEFVSQLKFDSDPAAFGVAESISTRFQLRAAKLASDVHLGSYTFSRPFVEINSAFPLANLGSCAMQNFVFTFDQKNGLVRFDSSQQTLRLAATPTPLRILNAPEYKPVNNSLVPIG
jgi:predicted aspartyl protease